MLNLRSKGNSCLLVFLTRTNSQKMLIKIKFNIFPPSLEMHSFTAKSQKPLQPTKLDAQFDNLSS